MSNYSTLQENTLHGLSEAGGILYLRLCDQFRDEKRAFFAAAHFDDVVGDTWERMAEGYTQIIRPLSDEVKTHLSQFMAERWRHNFMEAA